MPVVKRFLNPFAVAAVLAAFAWSAQAQQIHWHNDYAAAREEARKTGKPIFLAFRCAP